jgi:hypothetical protein
MSRQKSALTGVSGVDTVIAGGMLTSVRHEPAAVEVARRRLRGRAVIPLIVICQRAVARR